METLVPLLTLLFWGHACTVQLSLGGVAPASWDRNNPVGSPLALTGFHRRTFLAFPLRPTKDWLEALGALLNPAFAFQLKVCCVRTQRLSFVGHKSSVRPRHSEDKPLAVATVPDPTNTPNRNSGHV
jgi:hypothetical protein